MAPSRSQRMSVATSAHVGKSGNVTIGTNSTILTHSGHRDAFAERILWNTNRVHHRVSVGLNIGRPDYLAPSFGEFSNELAKVGG
jgi:hypothetical protein